MFRFFFYYFVIPSKVSIN